MVSILIVDDHPVVREGISKIISQKGKGRYKVVGKVDCFNKALRAVRKLEPDLIIVDVFLKGSDGIELVKCIKSQKGTKKINILVMSMHDEDLYAERALRSGADGYIMKQVDGCELYDAINAVARGEIYLSEKMTTKLLRSRKISRNNESAMLIEKLTDRELEVLGLLGTGLTTSQVALDLHLSIKTVETYCGRIKEKMGLSNFNQLILHAVQWMHFNSSSVRV